MHMHAQVRLLLRAPSTTTFADDHLTRVLGAWVRKSRDHGLPALGRRGRLRLWHLGRLGRLRLFHLQFSVVTRAGRCHLPQPSLEPCPPPAALRLQVFPALPCIMPCLGLGPPTTWPGVCLICLVLSMYDCESKS